MMKPQMMKTTLTFTAALLLSGVTSALAGGTPGVAGTANAAGSAGAAAAPGAAGAGAAAGTASAADSMAGMRAEGDTNDWLGALSKAKKSDESKPAKKRSPATKPSDEKPGETSAGSAPTPNPDRPAAWRSPPDPAVRGEDVYRLVDRLTGLRAEIEAGGDGAASSADSLARLEEIGAAVRDLHAAFESGGECAGRPGAGLETDPRDLVLQAQEEALLADSFLPEKLGEEAALHAENAAEKLVRLGDLLLQFEDWRAAGAPCDEAIEVE